MVSDQSFEHRIGYVCASCGEWTPTLVEVSTSCDHGTVLLPEQMAPSDVAAAKAKRAERLRAEALKGGTR